MNEITELTIIFSAILGFAIPICTYAGYRLGHFRGYAAARHLWKHGDFIYSQHSNQAHWGADKGEK